MKTGDLQAKLQQKIQDQESMMAQENLEQSRFTQSLREELNSALHIMQKDTLALSQQLTQLLKQSLEESQQVIKAYQRSAKLGWIKQFLITIPLLFTLMVSTWGLMSYMAAEIQSQIIAIKQNEQMLQRLEAMGGKLNLNQCGKRICVQIDLTQPEYENGYRAVK